MPTTNSARATDPIESIARSAEDTIHGRDVYFPAFFLHSSISHSVKSDHSFSRLYVLTSSWMSHKTTASFQIHSPTGPLRKVRRKSNRLLRRTYGILPSSRINLRVDSRRQDHLRKNRRWLGVMTRLTRDKGFFVVIRSKARSSARFLNKISFRAKVPRIKSHQLSEFIMVAKERI